MARPATADAAAAVELPASPLTVLAIDDDPEALHEVLARTLRG